MKVTLHRVTFEPYEAELPDTCPFCQSPMSDDAALIEQTYDACTYPNVRRGEGELEYMAPAEVQEGSFPIAYECGNCGMLLGGGLESGKVAS